MAHSEPPTKKVKDLDKVLERLSSKKDKTTEAFLKECREDVKTLKTEEEKKQAVNRNYQTFFVKTGKPFPDELKKSLAPYIYEGEEGNAQGKDRPAESSSGNSRPNSAKADEADKTTSQSVHEKNQAQTETSSLQAVKQELENTKLELKRMEEEKDGKLRDLNEQVKKKEKELHTKEGEVVELTKRMDEQRDGYEQQITSIKEKRKKYELEIDKQMKYLKEEVARKTEANIIMEKNINQLIGDEQKARAMCKQLEEQLGTLHEKYLQDTHTLKRENKQMNRKIDSLEEQMLFEVRKKDEQIDLLTKDRDDLRDRFSKVAGAKLSDQNADIADLSDPNRAMKLSERFGQLYDDEWTNAFEALSDAENKICLPQKNAVELLLTILKECLRFCVTVRDQQTDCLKNVLLHPVQNPNIATSEGMQNVQIQQEKPRVSNKDDKALRELRRNVALQTAVVEEVKQAFLVEAKSWDKEKKGIEKEHLEACTPYMLKCAEICWMAVLPDPPLYMKFDIKTGDKFDSNMYSVYSSSGEKYDFLVWPPLFNAEKGGLLAKGVAQPQKTIKKGK